MQITEQPSLYDHLEKKSVREILEDINREDQKVASAVQKAIPQIEHLVNLIVPRRDKRPFRSIGRFGGSPYLRNVSQLDYRTDSRR